MNKRSQMFNPASILFALAGICADAGFVQLGSSVPPTLPTLSNVSTPPDATRQGNADGGQRWDRTTDLPSTGMFSTHQADSEKTSNERRRTPSMFLSTEDTAGKNSNLREVFSNCCQYRRTRTSPTTKWRKRRDSNPRYPFRYASFQDWSHQPLGHSSSLKFSMRRARNAKRSRLDRQMSRQPFLLISSEGR